MEGHKSDPSEPGAECSSRTPRSIFARYGYSPLAPGELDERQLPGRLWELLYAAAARRFFFRFTDHLSDRELYTFLWEHWLDIPTAGIPVEEKTNTTLLVSDFAAHGIPSDEIYLRHYAKPPVLKRWSSEEPGFVAPPHEDPPYERDRFLPLPPVPLEEHAGWLPGDADEDPSLVRGQEQPESEQEGLAESAANEQRLAEFEAEMEAMEPENWVPAADTLAQENVPLLPPAEITDEALTPVLWELLHNLALRSFYLLHTDHLSDRELYAELWTRGLREPACLAPRSLRGGFFHDFLGSWGDDEMQAWLRLYATEEERAEHAREWPDTPMPPRQPAPYQRDWRLPKAPF